jgi:DeoR family transcriptional regulator, aga operon transcriptional repressor
VPAKRPLQAVADASRDGRKTGRAPISQSIRLRIILDKLAEQTSVDVDQLVAEFGVSAATIRRDLDKLADQRLLDRRHGGAVAVSGLYELPLRYRDAGSAEKRRIAEAALAHVPAGATVALTGGTTTTEVGRALVQRAELTVVTNAINIAAELAVRPEVRLIMTGGVARAASYELAGPLAEDSLHQVNVEIMFLGVDGFTATSGTTTRNEIEARTNRVMATRAKRVIVVADGSKIGRTALAAITDTTSVDHLITTADADANELAAIAECGVNVEFA